MGEISPRCGAGPVYTTVICPHGCPDAVDNYAGHCMTAYLRMKRRTLQTSPLHRVRRLPRVVCSSRSISARCAVAAVTPAVSLVTSSLSVLSAIRTGALAHVGRDGWAVRG